MCHTVGEESTKAWTELEKKLQSEREADVSVMDQFDIHKDKRTCAITPETTNDADLNVEPSKVDMTNLWIRKEKETTGVVFSGASRWIASGISLEEQQ